MSLKISPAKPSEMKMIKKYIQSFRLDDENLNYKQFVVAKENKKIVGFGRIKPYHKVYELGCLGVLEKWRKKGIGKKIVEYLIEIFPSQEVYITTDIPTYFEKLGFKRVKNGPQELVEKVKRVCCSKLRENVVIMVYQKEKK